MCFFQHVPVAAGKSCMAALKEMKDCENAPGTESPEESRGYQDDPETSVDSSLKSIHIQVANRF